MTSTIDTTTNPTPARTEHGETFPLGHPWPGIDPFLFVAHHLDRYPAGNERMGPVVDVSDRALGSDFDHPSGWSMYHGTEVPGFPAHPHRGFETITIVADGLVDHADSTGAGARYGPGDVQWVTAGGGVSHSEMFPLADPDGENPLDLYQIWINLPARDKTAPAEFKMLWNEDIPVLDAGAIGGGTVRVKVIAGRFGDVVAPAPPARSWAANPAADTAVWLVELAPGASVTLPSAATAATQRVLYIHGEGAVADVDGAAVVDGWGFAQTTHGPITVSTDGGAATVLVLQGVPIGEPVVQHGPFVMNTREELVQAFEDYRHAQFGGWPFPDAAPVHPRAQPRFARHGDGRFEDPTAR